MLKKFLEHYREKEEEAKEKLKEFEKHKESTHDELFEELTFCIFAANSSAEMGLKAVKLLKPILKDGTLEEYRERVKEKVRFYNKRSEYLHHNREKLKEQQINLQTLIKTKKPKQLREYIKENLKGLGLKESSHYLRNIGFKGFCIIDKHVLTVMQELEVLKTNKPSKNDKEYYEIEQKIKKFAKKQKLNEDVLDLAMWSYKTGKIIK